MPNGPRLLIALKDIWLENTGNFSLSNSHFMWGPSECLGNENTLMDGQNWMWIVFLYWLDQMIIITGAFIIAFNSENIFASKSKDE